MHLYTRNVNTAFRELVETFHDARRNPGQTTSITKRQSRNGPVLMIDEPVTVTYSHPRERVLFNAARDANPFLHLYEALWMLAGRNDVAPLAYYAKNMANYSDDGKTLNGAYGYRWRRAGSYTVRGQEGTYDNNIDQLDILINHLKADPNSRRAVLQMWNVEDDLLKIGSNITSQPVIDLEAVSKDVCCNLSVMFALRAEPDGNSTGTGPGSFLDMTVTNRSNDLIWGMLGADYVHFTFLQEYMAARLGVEVGKYHHFTNNLHVYTETNSGFKPEEWLAEVGPGPGFDYSNPNCSTLSKDEQVRCWGKDFGQIFPLVKDPAVFERELPELMETFAGDSDQAIRFEEPFLENVAKPMFIAFRYHKRGETDVALQFASNCTADDWRLAAMGWLERRVK